MSFSDISKTHASTKYTIMSKRDLSNATTPVVSATHHMAIVVYILFVVN